MTYHSLNAQLNLYDSDGQLQLDKDSEATREYFLQHVNQNTVFFHDLEEKIRYLLDNGYYEETAFQSYSFDQIKTLFKQAYAYRFRFKTFLGAYLYYNNYTLKTFDGRRYLERYEDRVCMNALFLSKGDYSKATAIMHEIMSGRYQPATPTFLNAGRKQRGEYVSCFLLRTEDNLESICNVITSSLQLSKRGGGVAINLTNIREMGAPIKNIENQSSGIIPIMKILEDCFSYANQLGARQGAGAVYLNVLHPDIMSFLDTKRENADEKTRIKSLSIGVVIPDVFMERAKQNQPVYLLSPYDVYNQTGVALSDIDFPRYYTSLLDNPKIRKKKIDPRRVLQTIAELQCESGYPYIVFEDNANKNTPYSGKVSMSNLCTEILQINSPSTYFADGRHNVTGEDICCNLGSLNIANVMRNQDIATSVETAIYALTTVCVKSRLTCAPSVDLGNCRSRAIGLGQMNLHGYLKSQNIPYGSPEALDFTNVYFYCVTYYALRASNELARQYGKFYDFDKSKYASGHYFEKYIQNDWQPKYERIRKMFSSIPSQDDWRVLKQSVETYGLYHKYLQAVAPTGSISYINHATSSIHPIADRIEVRKTGSTGRVYYPAPQLNRNPADVYETAYEIGYKKIIDTYAVAQQHVDQGLSLTLFFNDDVTTREINKAQIYAWHKGIKTLYYVRIKQPSLKGTEVEQCVSCSI